MLEDMFEGGVHARVHVCIVRESVADEVSQNMVYVYKPCVVVNAFISNDRGREV